MRPEFSYSKAGAYDWCLMCAPRMPTNCQIIVIVFISFLFPWSSLICSGNYTPSENRKKNRQVKFFSMKVCAVQNKKAKERKRKKSKVMPLDFWWWWFEEGSAISLSLSSFFLFLGFVCHRQTLASPSFSLSLLLEMTIELPPPLQYRPVQSAAAAAPHDKS